MTNEVGFGTAVAPFPLTIVRTVMGKKRHIVVTVNDTMQRNYRYVRSAPAGRSFDGHPEARCANRTALRARRSDVPAAASAAALGL